MMNKKGQVWEAFVQPLSTFGATGSASYTSMISVMFKVEVKNKPHLNMGGTFTLHTERYCVVEELNPGPVRAKSNMVFVVFLSLHFLPVSFFVLHCQLLPILLQTFTLCHCSSKTMCNCLEG